MTQTITSNNSTSTLFKAEMKHFQPHDCPLNASLASNKKDSETLFGLFGSKHSIAMHSLIRQPIARVSISHSFLLNTESRSQKFRSTMTSDSKMSCPPSSSSAF